MATENKHYLGRYIFGDDYYKLDSIGSHDQYVILKKYTCDEELMETVGDVLKKYTDPHGITSNIEKHAGLFGEYIKIILTFPCRSVTRHVFARHHLREIEGIREFDDEITTIIDEYMPKK